jgi:hypothetical protein
MTRANERKSQKSLSSFEKNSSVWSFNQTAHLCEKVGKGRKKKNKKKTGRQKLTSLPATDSRSLQNEKRKLVFVGPTKGRRRRRFVVKRSVEVNVDTFSSAAVAPSLKSS